MERCEVSQGRIPILSRTNLGNLDYILDLSPTWKTDVLLCLPEGFPVDSTRSTPLLPKNANNQQSIDSWLDDIGGGKENGDWGQENLDCWKPQTVGDEVTGLGHVYEFRALPYHFRARKYLTASGEPLRKAAFKR